MLVHLKSDHHASLFQNAVNYSVKSFVELARRRRRHGEADNSYFKMQISPLTHIEQLSRQKIFRGSFHKTYNCQALRRPVLG